MFSLWTNPAQRNKFRPFVPNKRQSVSLPPELIKAAKKRAAEQIGEIFDTDRVFSAYIRGLIRKDLEEQGIEVILDDAVSPKPSKKRSRK